MHLVRAPVIVLSVKRDQVCACLAIFQKGFQEVDGS